MSTDINPVLFVLDLHVKYTVEVVPLYTYMLGLLFSHSSPICKKCCRVFAHHHIPDDDSECPMDYELSLIPNVFANTHNNECAHRLIQH